MEPTWRHSLEEYFRIERNSAVKHEFRDGEIIDMSGGSLEHSLIIANVIGEIGSRLEGSPCRVYDSNLRVRIARKLRYACPDVTVICREPQLDPDDPSGTTVVNPRLVVEVLSPATELYDRGEKLRRSVEMESLQEYVMVAQDEARVETLFRQQEGTWLFAAACGIESTARLRSLNVDLPLRELYAGVTFPATTIHRSIEASPPPVLTNSASRPKMG